MRNRTNINSFFYPNRKVLYTALGIVMVSVLTLTVVYAALSTTLNINGNAEVTAASWDIYLDNVVLNSSSATTTEPTIIDKTTASFSTTLTKPGDFYEFTIDVVNNGSIDAMINNITKTPELSDTQKKYLNYIVEYQNGESITTKQLVEKKSFVRLKVKVEFRKDLTASDLTITSETLNLSFKVNYVQSDDSSENVSINNNGKLVKIVSGDYDTVGSEICVGEECFYVISSDEDSVTMLTKYNLEVGSVCTSKTTCTPIENPSGVQNSTMIGGPSDNSYPRYGTVLFSSIAYWENSIISYPVYVYDSNSIVYNYVDNYKTYLESQGLTVIDARLIGLEELQTLGCSKTDSSCITSHYSWVYSTKYWSGTLFDKRSLYGISSDGVLSTYLYDNSYNFGVRPVIVIPKSEF